MTLQQTGVLASNGREGFPHQVAMWYLPEPGQILMWSYGKAQKAVNLRRDPRASLLVESGSTDYGRLRGARIEGGVHLIEDLDEVLEIGIRLRLRNHPGTDRAESQSYIERQAGKRIVIVLPMERVTSWDHGKLPG